MVEAKVNVILTLYNPKKEWLEETIASVFEQEYKDWHLTIVDDASPEGHPRILEEFQSKYKERVSLFTLESNKRAAGARNIAINKLKSKFVTFIDQDDRWVKGSLAKQVETLENQKNVGLVHGNVRMIDEEGRELKGEAKKENRRRRKISYREMSNSELATELFLTNSIRIGSVMVERGKFKSIGCFDSTLFGGEDWEAWVRFADSYNITHVDDVFFEKRVHTLQVTSIHDLARSRGHFMALDKIVSRLPYLTSYREERKEILLRKNVRKFLEAGKLNEARNTARKLVKDNNCEGKDYILLLLTQLGWAGKFLYEIYKRVQSRAQHFLDLISFIVTS